MPALLITGGRVYDHDGDVDQPAIADVLIVDGQIAAVRAGLAAGPIPELGSVRPEIIDATDKLVMLELPHPDDSLLTFPLLPAHDTFGDKLDFAHPYLWWFAFNQVKGLPEQLLAGRVRAEQDWLFKYFLVKEDAIDGRDRAVYERAYDTADSIRASNGWYRAFTQDVLDYRTYGKVDVPVLAMGGPAFRWMKKVMPAKVSNLTAIQVEDSGHFIHEEQPELITKSMLDFLQGPRPATIN